MLRTRRKTFCIALPVCVRPLRPGGNDDADRPLLGWSTQSRVTVVEP
jgi:hypothetical protein